MRTVGGAVLLTIVLSASVAHAQVDLTGTWTVTVVDAFVGPQPLEVQLTQNGTDLTWTPVGGSQSYAGTFDGSALHVVGPDSFDPLLGPIPGVVIDGVVADANHFSGTYAYSFVKITPPPCIPYCRITDPFTAARQTHICGDGLQSPEEGCDHGPANGTDGCCAVDCTLVDPDHDGVCSAEDDCPDVYDEAQDDVCRAGVLILRRATVRPPSVEGAGDGVVKLTGTLTGRAAGLGDADTFLFTAGTVGTNGTAPPCEAVGGRRTVCRSADGATLFAGRLARDGSSIQLRARFPVNFGAPPASGPIGLMIRNAVADLLWTGVTGDCRTSRAGVLRCEGSR